MTAQDQPPGAPAGWWERPFASFDIESTGVDPETARIVTATVVHIDPGAGTTRAVEWLLDPGVEIPAEATEVHGITTEYAHAYGSQPAGAVREIAAELAGLWDAGRPVVVYNAPYDCTLLDRELRRHGAGELVPGNVVDPLVIDKEVDRYRPKRVAGRKLAEVAAHYGVPLSEQDAHGSTADAVAAARVAWMLARRWPQVRALSLPELHAAQVAWYAAQSGRFKLYLGKLWTEATNAGKAEEAAELEAKIASVDSSWPMRVVAA